MQREFIQKLINLVEANLANETFGPDELVREAGMSHSNLNRRLKLISNQNISQFIRELRLKKAKELLLNEALTVAEISYQVGFGSPTYFNKCFREFYGVSPGELRNHEPDAEPEEQPIETITKKPKRTRILISLAIGLMVLFPTTFFLVHSVAGSKALNVKEKSIALLPFKSLSKEDEKQYLADGMMDAILLYLSKIKDLRVISRTSVEQYRKTDKTAKTIGGELDVAYVLEGSFQKQGDKVRIILQLIRTSDDSHVWSNEYDRQWKDIFSIQSEVAEAVAGQLQVVITKEEQQLIRKTPTTNLTAYNYYLRGNDLLEKYEFISKRDSATLGKAKHFFYEALALDSTFALAYTGLAGVQFWISRINYLSDTYLDSVLFYANKALACDYQCAEAYYYRGYVYSQTSKMTEAITEADRALSINPNNWKAYFLRCFIFEALNDYVGSISNLYEDVLRNRGLGQTNFLLRFSYCLSDLGFTDLAKKYNQQALELYGDTTQYLYCSAYAEYCSENFEKAYQIAKRANTRESTLRHLVRNPDISFYCLIIGHYEEAYAVNLKFSDYMKKTGGFDPEVSRKVAFYLWKTGRRKEAETYFLQEIKFDLENIKVGRMDAVQRKPQFDLAEVYCIMGNKEKAYQYLDEVNKNQSFPWYWVISFKYEPYFNSIRQEPRFQKIVSEVEAKYQAEHKRVGKWLKDQGML